MTSITNTEQVSTFTIVRDILLTDSTLNAKFSSKDYYEIEPKVKSVGQSNFNGYPFILIEIPVTEDIDNFLGDVLTIEEEFIIPITLTVEYDARSKVRSFSNAILTTLRAASSTFRANGYEFKRTNLVTPPEVTSIAQKDVVVTEFELVLRGEVVT